MADRAPQCALLNRRASGPAYRIEASVRNSEGALLSAILAAGRGCSRGGRKVQMARPKPTPMFELVKTLTEIPGPIGQEDRVHEWCARHWSSIAAQVEINPVGNVVARVGGQGPRLIVLAHGDELALMVKSITDNGLLRVWPAWRDTRGKPPHWYSPVNQPVLVVAENGPVEGQLCYASGHVIGGGNARE